MLCCQGKAGESPRRAFDTFRDDGHSVLFWDGTRRIEGSKGVRSVRTRRFEIETRLVCEPLFFQIHVAEESRYEIWPRRALLGIKVGTSLAAIVQEAGNRVGGQAWSFHALMLCSIALK